jgi:hypothetical protein
MLYLKIALALFLSAIPFLFKHLVMPSKESAPTDRNMLSAIGTAIPFLNRYRRKLFNISIRIYNAMKHSTEARKFFCLILLLVLMTIAMVDFNASASIARKVTKAAQESGSQSEVMIGLYTVYRPYLTFRYATLLAGLMVIPFFSYKLTDRILSRLAGSRRLFAVMSMATVFLLAMSVFYSSGRNIIIIQMLFVILGAASIYPRMKPSGASCKVHTLSDELMSRIYTRKYGI